MLWPALRMRGATVAIWAQVAVCAASAVIGALAFSLGAGLFSCRGMFVPRYVRLAFEDKEHRMQAHVIKAFEDKRGVFWDLARVVQALGFDGKRTRCNMGQWLRKSKALLVASLSALGLDGEAHITASRRSVKWRREHGDEDNAGDGEELIAHDVWTITTLALLALARACTLVRKTLDERAVAVRFLGAFLCETTTDSFCNEYTEGMLANGFARHGCKNGEPPGEEDCYHMRTVRGALNVDSVGRQILAKAMVGLSRVCRECPSARAASLEYFKGVAQHVEENLGERAWTSDPVMAHAHDYRPGQPGKRKRRDLDFARTVVARSAAGGGQTHKEGFADAHGVTVKMSAQCSMLSVLGHQAALWLTFGQRPLVGAVHYSIDGSRFGQPAREFEVAYAYHTAAGVGGWMPPKAWEFAR